MATSGNLVAPEHPIDTELADALAALDRIYRAVGVLRHHPLDVLLVNIQNMQKFARLLHAVEREFFMVPGEVDADYPDEEPDDVCLLNSWGSSEEQYLEDFRTSLAKVTAQALQPAARDVLAERSRQIESEGMSPESDDSYQAAELPRAAAAYILNGACDDAPSIWPWARLSWKPRDARSNYVRAGALILAELERLDRAAGVAISIRLTAEQLADLRRFRECCNDGECYDVPVERMRALAALGMVREEPDIEPDHYALTDAGRAALVAAARGLGQ